MSKVAGVIAEYNPVHKGHIYLASEIRKKFLDVGIISVMSGNFVQRGEPAVFDKKKRAVEAVSRGACDLILEMPVIYSTSSAADFAFAGVNILKGTGICDLLYFGSESGDILSLQHISKTLSEFKKTIEEKIKEKIKSGISYPVARSEVLKNYLTSSEIETLKGPNNILALEYLKNIYEDSEIVPKTILRKGKGHNESGAFERKKIFMKDEEFFNEREKRFFDMIRVSILSMTDSELNSFDHNGAGLPLRIRKLIRTSNSYEEFIKNVKTKRYTLTRIKREILHLLLKINQRDINDKKLYIKPIAFNEKGAEMLRKIQDSNRKKLPIYDKINKSVLEDKHMKRNLELEIRATDFFNIIEGKALYENSEYVQNPVFIN